MGNTHSETPIQRERDLPLQAVEVLQKECKEEKLNQRSKPSGKEQQHRAPPPAAGSEPPQVGEASANGQLSAGDHGASAGLATLDARAKPPNQGKKRKIAKARKWASGQAAAQETVVVDKLTGGERPHSARRTEQDRGGSAREDEGLASAVAALGFGPRKEAAENQALPQEPAADGGDNDGTNQKVSNGHVAGTRAEQGADACSTSKQRGQGEPDLGAPLPLSPASQQAEGAKAGKRAQLACMLPGPQGRSEQARRQSAQATVNGKESPCKLIKLSIIRSLPPCDKDKPPAFLGSGQREQAKGPAPPETAAAGGRPGERGQRGDPKPEAQPAPACPATPRDEAALASFERALCPDPAPQPSQLVSGPPKAPHPFLNHRGAQPEPGPNPADENKPLADLLPLPPGGKATAAHRAKHGDSAATSYAEALKHVPLLSNKQEVKGPAKEGELASPDAKDAKELSDAWQAQDGASSACKKKLPFYEQLIASLKSQTQRQKGAKPPRQILAQEEPLSKPAKDACPLEVPSLSQVSPKPLLPPSAEGQATGGSPQPSSQSSFLFEVHSQLASPEQLARTKADPKFVQWFQSQQLQQPIFQFHSKLGHQAGLQEQAEAASSVSFGPLCPTTIYSQRPVSDSGAASQLSSSVQLQSQSWLRRQIEAQCLLQPWSMSMGSPPPVYTQPPPLRVQPSLANPATDQLPIWPLFQSQAPAQAMFNALNHLPCQPRSKALLQAPFHLQISCDLQPQAPQLLLPQPPAQVRPELPQIQAQAASKAQHQSTGDARPSAPTTLQPKLAAKPHRLPPKASPPAASKAKSQAQAKGRKVQAAFPSQQPPRWQEPVKVHAAMEPAAEGKSLVQRPTGRWSAFQIDRTCTRKCHCRHREDQGTSHLPRNIATWTNSMKEPFCETPWVRTAVLAGSLVAGTKFCMDHFKANNMLS